MTYKVEITYERRDGKRNVLELKGIYVPTLAVAELFRTSGDTERVRRLVAWDLSLPRRSSFEPVRIVDQSFPDCWK